MSISVVLSSISCSSCVSLFMSTISQVDSSPVVLGKWKSEYVNSLVLANYESGHVMIAKSTATLESSCTLG